MLYEETALWKATLGDVTIRSDPYLSTLKTGYESFRTQVKPILEEMQRSSQHFANHGIEHSDHLWHTASMLIGDEVHLNPAEAFVLGASFLVHDIGMGVSGYENGIREIITSTSFLDILFKQFPQDAPGILEKTKKDIDINSMWDGLTSPQAKSAILEYMRRNHAFQAAKVLKRSWPAADGISHMHLIPDENLRHWFADPIGRIAKSSWLDVNDLPGLLKAHEYSVVPGWPPEWTIDEIKIGCLLRTSDAVGLDHRPTPINTFQHRNPQGVFSLHGSFKSKIAAPSVVNNKIQYSSSSPFNEAETEKWWLAFDTLRQVDSELRAVDNLFTDRSSPRLAASGVAGCDSPKRLSKYILTEGWIPVDAKPHIADGTRIMESLGGQALYGSNNFQWIPVRELLANALDASRAMRFVDYAEDPRSINVEFEKGENADFITIRDYGIGMTQNDVVRKLCAFGSSGWLDVGLEDDELTGIVAKGYQPTGRFGIGFFSVFMISDKVSVFTRAWNKSRSDTLVLEFTSGLATRPVLRQGAIAEKLNFPGTKVKIQLKERLHDYKGILSGLSAQWTNNPEKVARVVRHYAFLADENIDISVAGRGITARAVSRNEWQDAPASEVVQALNPTVNTDRPEFEQFITRFESTLSPIYDSQGQMLGRIGVDILDENINASHDTYLSKSGAYVGGMHAEAATGIIGIISAKPQGAARDRAKFDVELENMQSWFKEQVESVLSKSVNNDYLTQMEVQAYGISLGVLSEDLPIAYSRAGFLWPKDIRERVRSETSIRMLEVFSSFLNTESGSVLGFSVWKNDFCFPSGSDICIYPGFSVYADIEREPLPVRKDELTEILKNHVRLEDQFDIRSYWKTNYTCTSAEIMRMCAVEWGVNLIDVVDSTQGYYNELDCDKRIDVPTISGKTRKQAALEVRRPV